MTTHQDSIINPLEALAKRAAAGKSLDRGILKTSEIDNKCGHFGMRIARDGTWFYQGTPIGRKRLCQLFSTVLRRHEDGSFWLVTPVERGLIDVEDAPFTAVEMTVAGQGAAQTLTFRTNLDEEITADADHPIHVEFDPVSLEPSPYIQVREGLDALIVRSVFYHLVDIAELEDSGTDSRLSVMSGGQRFDLGSIIGLAEKGHDNKE
ncbi:MAG: DUF1285 domain-containing protein [Alphaproteobacteria bacterium]|nr:DUF1285 domain-containing protein [Alphaproteobacteria bacterium]